MGLLVGVVFGALTATQYNSVSAQCNNMPCPANLQGAVDEGRAFQTIADTGFVIGGLGIATAAVLYFAVDRPNAQHRHEVHVGIQGTMLMVTGTF